MHWQPRRGWTVVIALTGFAVGAAAGAGTAPLVDVEQLPDAASLLATTARHPVDRQRHERVVLEMHQRGADECILRYLEVLDPREPERVAALREMLAGLYLRERRLYRARQQLDGITAQRRSDQARFLAVHVAMRQRRLDSAKADLAVLARRLPGDALVARDEAQVASLLGDHAAASDAAARLISARPNDEPARFVLARARMLQGRTAEARQLFEAMLARNARHGGAALNLGLLHLAGGELPAARVRFVQARALGNRDASPYAAESAAALLQGDRNAARDAAAGAVKQNPADPLAGLVDVLASGGAHDGPVRSRSREVAAAWYPDLRREPLPVVLAKEIEHPGAAGRIAAAQVLQQLWTPQAALDWLGSTDGEETQGVLAELAVVRALVAGGQYAEAGKRAARLESSAPAGQLAGPSVLVAEIATRLGDRKGAVEAMRRAIERAPGEARLHKLSGDLQNVLGQPARAIPEYRTARRLAPADPEILNQLAATLALAGGRTEHEEALRIAEEGLATRPHYLLRARLLDTRADLLYRLGRIAEARAAYRELSTTVGGIGTPEPWVRLAELEAAAGDVQAARRAYEEALDLGRDFPGRVQAVESLRRLANMQACEGCYSACDHSSGKRVLMDP